MRLKSVSIFQHYPYYYVVRFCDQVKRDEMSKRFIPIFV